MEYKPAPFDTSGVNLSGDILEVTELLARNAHDRWANLRLAEGWRCGPERNDQRKEHPGLIPYEQLSEAEKEYDRQTVLEAIKALLAMGYAIQPPTRVDRASSTSSPHFWSELQDLEASVAQSHVTLQRLWRERDTSNWLNAPQHYKLLARRILQIGEPLLAYDVAAEGVQRFPSNVELRQLLALALARSGAAGSANELLSELYAQGHRDEETVGLLARTHKDLAREAGGTLEARNHLRKAFDFYAQAYSDTGGYWTGLNAATLALLLGERERATTLAEQVSRRCREELNRCAATSGDRYWILSTLGETALLLRRWSEAREWYSQALAVGRGNWGNLHSTRQNARLLVQHLGDGIELVDSLFRFPNVVMFVGHMHPPELQPLLGYEFFKVDSETGRVRELDEIFGPEAQRDFWLKLDDLAHDICCLLEIVQRHEGTGSAVATESQRAPIFLAETTSDLVEQRETIRRDLQQHGYTVLPARSIAPLALKLKKALREDLARCQMSIHLIGKNYGLVPEGSAESLPEIQNELAIERHAQGDFARLLWIPPKLQVDDERQLKVIERFRMDPRTLDGADLLETYLEDLKTVIHDRLGRSETPPQHTQTSAAPDESLRRVYLICDQRDFELTSAWADFLFEQRVEVIRPVFEGDEAEIRDYHEENLSTCDGALIFYGSANECWLRRKLRELQKSAGYGRTKPAPVVGIALIAPRTAEKERFRTHEAVVIPQFEGLSPEPLRQFVSRLKG